MYKFWLHDEYANGEFIITKIEEIIKDLDIPEPDMTDRLEIQKSLVNQVDELIRHSQLSISNLNHMKVELSKDDIGIDKFEEVYNKLNDCI
jgi:hypothetical protein